MAVENRLSARQEQWFAAIRAGLEAETGTPLAEWIEIAKSCPETAHRARLAWFKTHHNLLQNRASYVLSAAFPPAMGWNDPDRLRDQLWSDPAARAIYDAIAAAVEALPEIVAGQRKGFSAWSRRYQFAAAKPLANGAASLGLAIAADTSPRLRSAKKEAWSERLTSCVTLNAPQNVDAEFHALLEQAWAAS